MSFHTVSIAVCPFTSTAVYPSMSCLMQSVLSRLLPSSLPYRVHCCMSFHDRLLLQELTHSIVLVPCDSDEAGTFVHDPQSGRVVLQGDASSPPDAIPPIVGADSGGVDPKEGGNCNNQHILRFTKYSVDSFPLVLFSALSIISLSLSRSVKAFFFFCVRVFNEAAQYVSISRVVRQVGGSEKAKQAYIFHHGIDTSGLLAKKIYSKNSEKNNVRMLLLLLWLVVVLFLVVFTVFAVIVSTRCLLFVVLISL